MLLTAITNDGKVTCTNAMKGTSRRCSALKRAGHAAAVSLEAKQAVSGTDRCGGVKARQEADVESTPERPAEEE